MKLLLDTHIWLWSFLDPRRLRPAVAKALEGEDSELWLSPITIWETLILAERGRLRLDASPREWIEEALRRVPMKEAALNHEVAFQSRRVPLPHQDLADRFLAATAQVYGLTLVTADEKLLSLETVPILAS